MVAGGGKGFSLVVVSVLFVSTTKIYRGRDTRVYVKKPPTNIYIYITRRPSGRVIHTIGEMGYNSFRGVLPLLSHPRLEILFRRRVYVFLLVLKKKRNDTSTRRRRRPSPNCHGHTLVVRAVSCRALTTAIQTHTHICT